MDPGKISRLAAVLSGLPEETRTQLARLLLPHGLAVVPRQCTQGIEAAFKSTAERIHRGVRKDMAFTPAAVTPCWQAMVDVAARDAGREDAEPG